MILSVGCTTVSNNQTEINRLSIDFHQSERPHDIERHRMTAQEAVAFANWTWVNHAGRAEYLLSANALASALRRGDFSTDEEQMRLSVMCLQHGMLAGAKEALKVAIEHWQQAYAGIHRVVYDGEAEWYKLARAALGYPADDRIQSSTRFQISKIMEN